MRNILSPGCEQDIVGRLKSPNIIMFGSGDTSFNIITDFIFRITSSPRAPPLEMKGRMYISCVRSSMTYGSETRPLIVDVGLKFERADD